MNGCLETARALLKAGNFDAAEREAQRELERDPQNNAAFGLIVEITLARGDKAQALRLAEEWVAMQPDNANAREQYIQCLLRLKRKRDAKKQIAAFERDFPREHETAEIMRLGLQAARGKSAAVVRGVAELRQRYGDHADFDEVEARMRSRDGQLFGAQKAADKVLKSNPLNLPAMMIGAVNAFRTCRFSKARGFARQIRNLEPRQAAAANEIIWASWIVLFPPFLAAHFGLMLMTLVIARLPAFFAMATSYFVMPLAFIPMIMIVNSLASWTGIPHFRALWYGAMALWIVYMFLGHLKFTDRGGKKPKPVRVTADY